jgi:hypothetical protein
MTLADATKMLADIANGIKALADADELRAKHAKTAAAVELLMGRASGLREAAEIILNTKLENKP